MFDPIPFATYSFVMSITPGPNNIMLTASGARFGFRRTLPHLLGVNVGFAVQMLAVCAGLGAVFGRWPWIQLGLQWAGAAYLLHMAWKILGTTEMRSIAAVRPVSFLEAALFQFVNPKAWVMTLTAAALFLPRELSLLIACAYFLGVMALINLPCVTVWALFGSTLRTFLTRPRRLQAFNAAMALALAATGVIMVV